jgi:hypothetical protein
MPTKGVAKKNAALLLTGKKCSKGSIFFELFLPYGQLLRSE